MLADALPSPIAGAVAAPATCAHCGQLVPRLAPGSERQFCCAGCASVYAILHDSGLTEYYRQRDASGAEGVVAKTTGRAYAELDQPEFAALYCRPLPDGRLGTELFLENVHCAACVWLVEKASTVLPGVSEARLDLSRAVLRLAWDPAVVRASRIASWLDSIGYPCHPLQGLDRDAVRRRADRLLLMRIGVAGAAAGNAMLLAIAMYSGAFSGMEPRYFELFRLGSALVALPSILWSASVFHRGALAAIRTLTPHMDLPVSIGILVGAVSGLWNTFRSRGDVYFDTITMLVFLLLVGRFLQQRQQRKAEGAADLLHALAPSTARVLEEGVAREVPVQTVPRGALVEIRAGEHVPVDGVVVEGASTLDTSLLTGESLPVPAGAGDGVHAGSVNVSGRLVVRAEETGQGNRLARLVRTVEEVAARKAPVVILANRLSGYFVMGVLGLALATALSLWTMSPATAVQRAVALLVVTCPCALALATPLAVSVALGRAARQGLMVKGGEFLEALARPALIVCDKTGTLTEGKLSVLDFAGDPAVKPWVRAVEAQSAHPIARALASAFAGPDDPPVESMEETLGGGVRARVAGHALLVGSPRFVRENTEGFPAWVDERIAAFSERALSPVLVAVDGDVRAVVAIGDPVRDDARRSLEALRKLGHRLAVLSGDQPAVVRAVVSRIGVPFEHVIGGATPEAKLAFIEARRQEGLVFMVGDGVNDAAALSAATVGIAVHGGAEASLAAADVFATKSGLLPVVELVVGARRTLRVIRGNLARSLVYNVTVGVFTALGFVGPLLAALLMPVSSIGVIASSYRSRTFGERT
jgi:Cu2+-exporting ATPase